MRRLWTLLCAVLVALAFVPAPAMADIAFPGRERQTQPSRPDEATPEDEVTPEDEAKTESTGSGCTNAAVEAHAGSRSTAEIGLVAVVVCVSLTATAGIYVLAQKRS